ncbi:MAG: cupin domain-containing protein [Dehalococcoidia bacterium]
MPRTTHTPSGKYPEHTQVHHLDLEAAADDLLARLPGNRRQSESLAREQGVSVIMMAMEEGDALKEHSAAGVVTVQLLRGQVAVGANGEVMDLAPRQMVLFQPGVRHSVEARERSVILLTVTGGEQDG